MLDVVNHWEQGGTFYIAALDTGAPIAYSTYVIANATHTTKRKGNIMATTKTTKTAKTYSPKELAAEIGVDAKVLRAYLRKNHTRDATAKNTSWIIPASVADAARKAFKKNEAKA